MCGRFTHKFTWAELHRLMRLSSVPTEPLVPRFNVAPTQTAPVVRQGPQGREGAMLRWGLVPSWAEDASMGSRLINARAEGLAGKPSFRGAFQQRRCIAPVSGFYEWRAAPRGERKQPFYFTLAGGGPMALGALWESWRQPGGTILETFTIITTGANALVAPVHDRMPVILPPEAWDRWLEPGPADQIAELLVPLDPAAMASWPVGPRVGSPANDEPSLIEPTA